MARPVNAEAGPRHAGRPRLILLVIAIAQLMVMLDATVVNIALPISAACPALAKRTTIEPSEPTGVGQI